MACFCALKGRFATEILARYEETVLVICRIDCTACALTGAKFYRCFEREGLHLQIGQFFPSQLKNRVARFHFECEICLLNQKTSAVLENV